MSLLVPDSTNLYRNLVSTPAASFTISSISQAYENLQLVIVGRLSGGVLNLEDFYLQINSDVGVSYDHEEMNQIGNALTSSSSLIAQANVGKVSDNSAPAAARAGYIVIDIPFYINTNFNKVVLSTSSLKWRDFVASAIESRVEMNNWQQTVAITSLTIGFASNLVAGSFVGLYGY